jgi:hypothetical protein
MAQTPAQKLRSKNLATAKRSLKLIAEQAAADLAVFENGGVPDLGAFRASMAKYEQALLAVSLLDSLGDSLAIEAGGADGNLIEVRAGDLEALVLFVRQSIIETGGDPDVPGTAIALLTQAVYPDGSAPEPVPATAGAE